jgi:hypothetical protein
MDGKRPGALSDAALDRELQAALDVDPSPEFVARVRLRVADDAIGSSRLFPWRWGTVAGGALAAAVMVLVLAWPPAEDDRRSAAVVVRDAPEVVDTGTVTAARETARREIPDQASGSPPARQRVRQAVSAPQRLEPTSDVEGPAFAEVLISPDEVRAYEMVLAAVQQRTLPPLPAPEGRPDGDEGLDIEIPALVIEPLPAMARLE